MLQPHVTPLPLALVAAVHAACLFALVAVFRAPSPQFPGWRVVRPGVMPWVVFIGSWAFAMMVTWAWLFVGSSLSDAEEQMRFGAFPYSRIRYHSSGEWLPYHKAMPQGITLAWPGS